MSDPANMTGQFDHGASVEAVRTYFDVLGAEEWDRLTSTPAGLASFEVHRRFLARFVTPGMRVLKVGAGPGRFTIALARLGARVVVTDLSPVQLELNARYVAAADLESAVESRSLLDVCDVGRFRDDEFDAVLAYGGPLSCAFDRAAAALRGLLRVTRVGGPVVASVMSTLGAYRHFLPAVLELSQVYGDDVNDRILATGDLRETQTPGSGQHTCRMFRSRAVETLLPRTGQPCWACQRATGRPSATRRPSPSWPRTPSDGRASWPTRSRSARSRAPSTAARTCCSPPPADQDRSFRAQLRSPLAFCAPSRRS